MAASTANGRSALTLVCLPWFGVDHRLAEAAIEPAVAAEPDLRRLYVDLPGTGDTPPAAPSSEAVLDAVDDYITRRAGHGPILLAGCSYGGYLAAALARRKPNRFAGLLLICAGVKIASSDRELPPPGPTAAWLAAVPADLRDHLAAALGTRSTATAVRVAELIQGARRVDEEYLGRLRTEGYRLADESDPTSYDQPVLVVAGRQDRVAGFVDPFRRLDVYPQASYAVLDEAGHYLPFEQPALFKALVEGWLQRCRSSLAQPRRGLFRKG